MIRASDIYPEFVGDNPTTRAKVTLARVNNSRPVATTARRPGGGGNSGGGNSNHSNGSGHSNNSTGSLPSQAMKFVKYYQGASQKFGIPWQILASIHQTETSFGDTGSNSSPNEAGAVGPMQFLPSTWEGYKQDGNGDGKKDINNVADAIYGAAALLRANHGSEGLNGLKKAIFQYNHADWYVEKILNDAKSFGWDGKTSGATGGDVTATGDTGGGGTASGIDAAGMQATATGTAFAVVLEGPSEQDRFEATQLTGPKSYLNDKPLIEFVDEICNASMRHYQSLPDGRFYAFFPDYFGSFHHRQPYWEIDDIEITNFDIYLSDEELHTHVYVVGDTLPVGTFDSGSSGGFGPDFYNRLFSSGVVTIFDAFNLNWLMNDVSNSKDKLFADANAFLRKYGVRPYYEKAPMIHSPYYELFVAFQRFMFLWARQFLTQCTFTFMPELYPGGRVAFKNHDMICYVDSVKHEFDYENGFTTTAQLSAPSSDVNNSRVPLGLIRPETGGQP